MITHKEQALAYFSQGYSCSQSVLAAFHKELGVTEELAIQLGSCFGGGMRKGEVCGACTGALMVIGLKYGQTNIADTEARMRTNTLSCQFLDTFRERNGSYICNALLGYDLSKQEEAAKAKEKGLFTEFCPKMVASAVEILEQMFEQNCTCAQ